MKKRKTQIAAGIFLVISLFVSSVSACACPHHEGAVEKEEPSCHSHGGGNSERQVTRQTAGPTAQTLKPGECCCIQPSPKAAVKTEKNKSPNKAVASSDRSLFVLAAAHPVSVTPVFERPWFLTDSFYNLTPGRAPPRL